LIPLVIAWSFFLENKNRGALRRRVFPLRKHFISQSLTAKNLGICKAGGITTVAFSFLAAQSLGLMRP
jgi:hypothetical protein